MTEAISGAIESADDRFEALLAYIRDHRGFDFTGYKRASLRRRVGKRMGELGIEGYQNYIDQSRPRRRSSTSCSRRS